MTRNRKNKMVIRHEAVEGHDDIHNNCAIETFSIKSCDKSFLKRKDTDVSSESDFVCYFKSATLAEVCGVKMLMIDNGCGKEKSRILVPMTEVEEIGIVLI